MFSLRLTRTSTAGQKSIVLPLSAILSFYEQLFGIVQQLDHHLADVNIQVVMFQRGEGQEACACYYVDTT